PLPFAAPPLSPAALPLPATLATPPRPAPELAPASADTSPATPTPALDPPEPAPASVALAPLEPQPVNDQTAQSAQNAQPSELRGTRIMLDACHDTPIPSRRAARVDACWVN